jgi:hypothetical protein
MPGLANKQIGEVPVVVLADPCFGSRGGLTDIEDRARKLLELGDRGRAARGVQPIDGERVGGCDLQQYRGGCEEIRELRPGPRFSSATGARATPRSTRPAARPTRVATRKQCHGDGTISGT